MAELSLSDTDVDRIAARVVEHLAPRLTAPAANPEPLLFTEQKAAEMLAIAPFTLRRWREKGLVHASVAKKPVRYSRKDIETVAIWMNARDTKD